MKIIITFTIAVLLAVSSVFAQINFIAMGDWGREGKYLQKETAERMGIYADGYKTNFIISLGDNIYDWGVAGTDDPKWDKSFESVYTAPSLQIPWYASLGNHDYYGNVQAQIDYSAVNPRWHMPARYYSFEQSVYGKVSALFVIIDTNPFIESYRQMKKDGKNDQFVDDVNSQDPEKQLKWIDSVLSSSDARWKIVAGHHPVYSGGEHRSSDDLIEKLEPVLDRNNVDIYMAGHDHDMQYLKKEESSVNYLIAGTGSKLRQTGKMEYTVFSASVNGFLGVTVSADTLNASFIDIHGNHLYDLVITK